MVIAVQLLAVVLGLPIVGLMALASIRGLQERRAARAGLITFGGDDRYQARNIERNIHDAVMIARVKLDISAEGFEEIIERVQTSYLAWYEALLASIEHRPAEGFDAPLEIRDEYVEYRLSDTPLLARIGLYREPRMVVLIGNHVYLGGYLLSQFVQLVFCRSISKGVFPRNRYVPVLTELMILALFGRLLLRPPRVLSPLFGSSARIRRLYWRRDLADVEAKASALRMNHLYVVLAEHVLLVMRCMGRDRLRVTLPVSFEAEDSFNTVGAVFLDIDLRGQSTTDVDAMARTMRKLVQRKRWQVSASNHVQRIFPTRKLSEQARNTVDLTLTVVPQKTLPDNLLAQEMTDYEFTMDNIQYPVYVMAFIFEGQVHSSFMVNSPDFDIDRFVQDEGAQPMDLALRWADGTGPR